MLNDKDLNGMIPGIDPNYFLPQGIIKNLNRIEKLSKRHPVNVLVVGKQGCGKSSLVKQFAAYYKRPLSTFQIGLLSEPGQLFGEKGLKEGNTFFEEFLFPKAISTPRSVIHLEEINRPEHPKALNDLFSVLSEDRSIWVEGLGLVKVADGVIFFATLNEGAEFTGIDMMDAALRDRFYIIQVDYPPADIEEEIICSKTGVSREIAKKIINVINLLRNNAQMPLSISIRHSLMIAELVSEGADIRDALIYSIQIEKSILETALISLHLGEGEEEILENQNYVRYI
ncbi:MAG TPA: AAA family ATPase [Candidatus Atribacteria bacterium]|nr:AAA family ATPase [Candidatus Atribacteria bacterium]